MGPLPEYLARCCPPGDGEVCRTGENPYSAQGALKVLYLSLIHISIPSHTPMVEISKGTPPAI